MPSFAAAPLLWEVIATSAIAVVTQRSRSTRAETGTAQNARPMHARGGFADGSKNCCQLSTIISSSAFLTHWCRSFGRTRESCLRSCSKLQPPLYWKLQLIRNISAPRLDFSASCTLGDRLSNNTRTFIVSCRVVAFLETTRDGFPHDPISSCL